LDQREDQTLVLAEKLSHFLAAFGLRCLSLRDSAGVEKVAIDLSIQIFPISNNHEGEVSCLLAKDLSRVKDHRETFA
jgi:hypothetical protein